MKRSDKSFVSGSEMSKIFLSPLQTPTFQFTCITTMFDSLLYDVFFFEKQSLQTPKTLYHKVSVYAHNHSSSNLTARFHPLSLKQSN